MENVTLSIIVPVYNVEKYVEKCLVSLMGQTFQDFEVIIVNDGSTDLSRQICADFINAHDLTSRFFIFDKINGGLSDARNYGLERAKGFYVAFLDSDDYVESSTYQRLVEKARSSKCDLVDCNYFKVVGKRRKKVDTVFSDSIKEFAAFGNVVAWNKLYRRETIVNNKLVFPKGLYYEDVAFFYQVLSVSKSISHVNMNLIDYVQRKGSISNSQSKRVLDILKIYSQIIGSCPSLSQEIEYRCIRNLTCSFRIKAKKISNKEDRCFVYRSFVHFIIDHFPTWQNNCYLRSNNLVNVAIKFYLKRMIKKYAK